MKLEQLVIRYPYLIIATTVLLLVGSVLPLLDVEINPDLETYMPATMPTIVSNKKVEATFGRTEPLMIILETDDVLNPATLSRIQGISEELQQHQEFNQVLSLFQTKNIHGADGMMIVDPAIQRIPKTEVRREKLREELLENELACGLVVSEDFRYALILLNTVVENQDQEVMDLVYSALEAFPGEEKISIGGQLFLRVEANDKMGRDLIILLPIAILVMLVFLWFSFRELKGVLLPFVVVLLAIAVSMALIPLFGWQLSIIGVLIPIMMVAIANNYGVHFIAKYQELNASKQGLSMKEMVVITTRYLTRPILLTGLTTMVGIIGLVAHILLPAKQMGIVVAIGIGLALLLSLTFIPAVMSLLKKGRVHEGIQGSGKTGLMIRILARLGRLNVKKPVVVIAGFVLVLLVAGAGLFRLRVASDFNGMLPSKHPFNQSIAIADQYFGGTKTIQVSFYGDMKDPVILKRMDHYAEELEQLEGVGRVTSLASVIRIMSQSIYEPGEEGYDAIPDSRDAVAQFLELYSMSGDPADFEQLVDFNYENALLTLQYQASKLKEINHIRDRVGQLVDADPNLTGIAGFSLVEKELCETIAVGQAYSLLFALLAIMLLLMLIFRSFQAGLIGSIPLFFAVICTFGLMGWLNIDLNIVTALLSSISIGLGVDYTIHMFWRLKAEILVDRKYEEAVKTSLVTIGRGITVNAFAVMLGFSVLFLSGFPLIRTFAFLIIISLFLCLVCSLLLVPSVVMLRRPGFLLRA